MISYYSRPDGANVKMNDETKEVVLVLVLPVQKTISQINNPEYYDRMTQELEKWTVSDETSFNEVFNTVKDSIFSL